MDTRTAASCSLIGQHKSALDTPALLVDLDVMEANIARIVATCRAHGVAWRPHSKAHKTPEIAHMQIAAGATGVTCAKLGEAEVMAAAGIRDILIANQIVGPIKIGRLVDLADRADPIVCADSIENLTELDAAFTRANKRLRVAIEVDIGMNRAGVEPGAPVVAFAREIANRPGLRFAGVVGWEAHATTIGDAAKKEQTVRAAVSLLTASARACREAGYRVEVVSCGGTGTFPYCAHVDFSPALTVLTTVTSRPTPTRIVVDAGKKTMSGDAAMPAPSGLPPIAALKLSAEHAKIELEQPSDVPKIGDKIEFIVGYSDTTVHLHEDRFDLARGRARQDQIAIAPPGIVLSSRVRRP
ncbi:MAG: DSD1 family PLP-dependent enzyme [Betaproteobacteria bacterium]|nr:MAG: DSD1 family PLP-dependent enzyme [Betaproteobacteria bacterium]